MPQVIEVILSNLDGDRITMLNYRLVNSQWRVIINSILEKRAVSRQVEAFPKLGICTGQKNILQVWSPLWISDEENYVFPTKSLTLAAITNDSSRVYYRRRCTELSIFLSRFGGNLTTLQLSNVILEINDLVIILSPLISLKLLSLTDVSSKVDLHASPEAIPLLAPITQPNLSTLVIKGDYFDERKKMDIYVWLIGSFSHQLEELDFDFGKAFWASPEFALLPGHQVTINVAGFSAFERLAIAPFPDSAFCKLKKLSATGFGGELPRRSVTPMLQHLSLETRWWIMSIEDFCGYIDKNATTLESILVNVIWGQLLDRFPNALREKAIELGGKFPTSSVKLPKVKTLAIPYPREEIEGAIIKYTLLPKFPNLQTLDLLNFRYFSLKESERIVKEVVERADYWNACENLKVIRISSWGEPTGNIYASRRPDGDAI